MFRLTDAILSLLIGSALAVGCAPRSSESEVGISGGHAPFSTQASFATPLAAGTQKPLANSAAGAQSATADYFRNADCYGERLADCLGVNAELDARAVDPIECKRPEPRVCLVPVGKVRTDIVDAIIRFHKESRGLEVLILPSIPITTRMIDQKTSQVFDIDVREAMDGRYGVVDTTASTFIAITPVDMTPKSGQYQWIFGIRSGTKGGYNRGAFSYFRMQNVSPYDGSPLTTELLGQRVAKYTARYTALLYYRYPLGDDINFLNYRDMFGFSDLDSMGTRWPVEPPPRP